MKKPILFQDWLFRSKLPVFKLAASA